MEPEARKPHCLASVVEAFKSDSEDGPQRLPYFTAPTGSPAVEQLRLLAVIGTQDLDATPSTVAATP